VNHYLEHPDDFRALARSLERERLEPLERPFWEKYLNSRHEKYLADFPLVILHGYADRMAARGEPVGPVPEIDFAVLAWCSGYDTWLAGREGAEELQRIDKDWRSQVAEWCDVAFSTLPAWSRERNRLLGELHRHLQGVAPDGGQFHTREQVVSELTKILESRRPG
jgi:hypothetical protein